MTLIILHIVSFLFGFFCGRHDVPAVNSFTMYGSSKEEQDLFHGGNWKLKLCFAVIGSLSMPGELLNPLRSLFFLVAGLDTWIIFDPVVAATRREKKKWFYLSNGNKVDRFLLKLFGESAGIYKTAGCIILSGLLTYIYFRINQPKI